MVKADTFEPASPPAIPDAAACVFYTCMDFPDGTSVTGPWDIRGRFSEYIGHYPIEGKTLLDVGTASGFLAFSAESAGARVTALEGKSISEYDQLHFSGLAYHENRVAHDANGELWFENLKNSFWYCWHKTASSVEVVYAPLRALSYWGRRFDVVVAGAILEHLADPVSTIWALTQLANEAVIIAFTPVEISNDQGMVTMNDWSNSAANYSWWTLSSGLYRRIFANVGFEMDIFPSTANFGGATHERSTIVARHIRL